MTRAHLRSPASDSSSDRPGAAVAPIHETIAGRFGDPDDALY